MRRCKKCGGKVESTEAIKNYYEILKTGETGVFIDDYDGLGAKMEYECIGCRRSIKFRLKNLKRIAIWEE